MQSERMTKPVLRCLMVDDDQDDQEIFLMALNKTGLNVQCETAIDGNEGLRKLQQMKPLPDYVFLDLNMPNCDGKCCLSNIRKIKAFNEVPVIIYSTSSYINDIRDSLKLGATGFITKPANVNELVDILTQIFSGTYSFQKSAYYM